jgi:hypothetical protein
MRRNSSLGRKLRRPSHVLTIVCTERSYSCSRQDPKPSPPTLPPGGPSATPPPISYRLPPPQNPHQRSNPQTPTMAPADAGGGVEQPRKAHRVAKSGAKAQKRKGKGKGKGKGAAGDDEGGERKNPKVRTGPAACLFSPWCPMSFLRSWFGICGLGFCVRVSEPPARVLRRSLAHDEWSSQCLEVSSFRYRGYACFRRELHILLTTNGVPYYHIPCVGCGS